MRITQPSNASGATGDNAVALERSAEALAASNGALATVEEINENVEGLQGSLDAHLSLYPLPVHQALYWDETRTETDKYDTRDTATFQFATYYGPVDPETVGRTVGPKDLWEQP